MTVRRRLTASSVVIALAAVLVLGVPLGIVEAARVRGEQTARLEREADAVASYIDDRVERGRPVTARELVPLARPGHRLTVVAGGQTVTGPIAVEVTGDTDCGAIAVRDSGLGVPEDQVDRIFERAATMRDGTGIGLHLARALAVSDGGTLRLVAAAPPRFEMRLRAAPPDSRGDGSAADHGELPMCPPPRAPRLDA